MSTVTRGSETIDGLPGVRFATTARPDSPQEQALQRVQAILSGGVTSLPDPTTLPHLALQSVQVVDGSSYSVITLWVPKAQESEAAEALRAEGFEVW